MKYLFVKLPEPKRETQKVSYIPPIGLWSIQRNLQLRGHEVDVLDLHLDPINLFEKINGYDVIGISAQFSIQHDYYIQAAALARTTGSTVIAGGFHAAAVPPPSGVDLVVQGEGETVLIPGLTFDQIEYPKPDAERMRPYWEKGSPHDLQSKTDRWMPVEFSRGCFRECGYCGVKNYWGTPRYFSKEKIRTYLLLLFLTGIKEVFIEDDNLLADPDMFEFLLRELRRFNMVWSTPNGIPARELTKYVSRLAESGCWRVSLPFETGSHRTANLMKLGKKWMPFNEASNLVGYLKNEGIKTCGFFIIGYPGETLDDMRDTLDYANGLPLDQRNIYIATPYPGTPLYDLCMGEGYLTVEPPELYRELLYTKGLIETEGFSPKDVEKLKADDRDAAIERMR